LTPGASAATAGFGLTFLLMPIIGIALFIAWIISIIDVLKNEFYQPNNKYIWIALLVFMPPLGAILYQTIGKNQKV
jgi:hypothetical protein